MAADKTFIIEVKSTGTGLVIKEIKNLNKETSKLKGTQDGLDKTSRKRSLSQTEQTKQFKGVAGATANQTKAFSKLSQQMGGIVPIYAQVAANVFAITAAFGALERAADLSILVNASEELAVQTGRSLTSLAESMQDITGHAINMKEALTQASIASSAGFDNSTIKELTQVARNASVALGRDMTDSLNRVFKGAIKAEPELLDELGIILRLETASKKYAAELGKTVKELSTFEKQQAVVNEVLDQGEKKFGRLSEVDPNSYTQLAAAFSDITVNLIQLVSTPFEAAFGFLSDNTTALTLLIVAMSTAILKQALPAFKGLGSTIGTSLTNATTSMKEFSQAGEGLAASLSRPSGSKEGIGAFASAIISNMKDAGQSVTAVQKRILSLKDGSKQQLSAIEGSFKQVIKNANKGFNVSATPNQIKAMEATLVVIKRIGNESSLTETKTRKLVTTTANLTSRMITLASSGISKASSALTLFGLSASNAANVVNSQAGAISSFRASFDLMLASFRGAKGAQKVIQGLGAAVGGFGTAIFKAIPFITAISVAWSVLSSLIGSVKDFFDIGDTAKLTEKLEDQKSALEDSAKAVNNYKENLAGLPDTLSNINEKAQLQANVLAGLAESITLVNTAIKVNKGFSSLSEVADLLGFGDIDNLKDNIDQTIKQLDDLGFADSISQQIRDVNDAFTGGGLAEAAGIDLELLVKRLRKGSEGVKEANNNTLESLKSLNKNAADLFGALPQQTNIEKSISNISILSTKLNLAPIQEAADIIAGLDDTAKSEFGLVDLGKDIDTFSIFSESASDRLKVLSTRLKDLNNSTANARGIQKTELKAVTQAEIDGLTAAVKSASIAIKDKLNDPLKETKERLEEISQAGRNLTKGLNSLKLEKLSSKDNSIGILKQETALRLKNISLERERDTISRANTEITISDLKDRLKALSKPEDNAKLEDKNKFKQDLETILLQQKTAQDKLDRLDTSLEASSSKSLVELLKLEAQASKELDGIINRQATGAITLSAEYSRLVEIQKESLLLAAEAAGKTDEQALAILNSVTAARELAGFLALNNVGDLSAQEKSTASAEKQSAVFQAQLDLNKELNDTLFLRANQSELLAEQEINRQLQILEIKLNTAKINTGASVGTEDEASAIEAERKIQALINQTTKTRESELKARTKGLEVLAKKTIQFETKRLKLAKLELIGNKFNNRLIKEKLALNKKELELQSKGLNPLEIAKQIKAQKELNKLTAEFSFADSLRDSAQAMNEFADATNRAANSIGDPAIDSGVQAMRILQDVGSSIGGVFGDAAKGFATFANTLSNVESITKGVAMQQAALEETQGRALSSEQILNFERKESALQLANAGNALGALAGSFQEGTGAAQAFTIAQQAVAVASAASAIATAGTGEPFGAIARVAAMTAAMIGMFSSFGIGGGGSSSGSSAAQTKKREETKGSQGLIGRELKTNTLKNGLSNILAIDNLLYGETKKMVNSLQNLENVFAGVVSQLFRIAGSNLEGIQFSESSVNEKTEQIDSGLLAVSGISALGLDSLVDTKSLKNLFNNSGLSDTLNVLTLGVFGNLGDKVGEELGKIFGSTKITESVKEFGLRFRGQIKILGDELVGTLDTDAFNLIQIDTRKRRAFRSTKRTTRFEERFQDVDDEVSSIFQKTFNTLLDSIVSLSEEFSNGIGLSQRDNLDRLQRLDGLKFEELPELTGLGEEEAGDVLTAFFTAIGEDAVQVLFPFLKNFTRETEGLGDALIRITTDTIRLNQAFGSVGLSVSDFAPKVKSFSVFKDINGEIVRTFDDAFGNKFDISGLNTTIFNNAAELQEQITVAYEEALLAHFGGSSENFQDIFQVFAEQIFNPDELKIFKRNDAIESLRDGFNDIQSIVRDLDLTSLNKILEEGRLDSTTVRKLFEEAEAIEAFGQVFEGQLLGADLNAILINLGPALAQLKDSVDFDELADEIDNLNRSYERQIAIFSKLGQEADLLQLDFDFEDAIEEAVETGTKISLVEELFGLRRVEIIEGYLQEIQDLNNSFVKQIATFGKSGKDLDLLNLSFDFSEALANAKEIGSDIGLVELSFGLRRIEIIKNSFEEIESIINDSLSSVSDSIVEVSRSSSAWDEVSFSIAKTNKLVQTLNKGLNKGGLNKLLDSTDISDFINIFPNILKGIAEEVPGSIEEQIELIDQLRDELVNRFNLELELIQGQSDAFKQLAVDIQGFLDSILLNDSLSPLTNSEQLAESERQFLTNLSNVNSSNPELQERARSNILSSAEAFLSEASNFFAIGPEFQLIFDSVTSSLSALGLDFEALAADTGIQDSINLLSEEVVDKLGVLDSILTELNFENIKVRDQDIADSITKGLLPELGNLSRILTNLRDDTFDGIVDTLNGINTINPQIITAVRTLDNTFRVHSRSGEIIAEVSKLGSTLSNSFNGVGQAMANAIQKGLGQVSGSIDDLDELLKFTPEPAPAPAPSAAPFRADPIGNVPGRSPIEPTLSATDALARLNNAQDFVFDSILGFGSESFTKSIIGNAFLDLPDFAKRTLVALGARVESFAVGTPNVPRDMMAQIHQGEAILPESMAAGLRSGSLVLGNVPDNTDVVAAIKELTEVLSESQEDISDATNRNIEVSQDIANSINSLQPVTTINGVL